MSDQETARGRIWKALEDVKDPEIPVISVVEMGIIRDILVEGKHVTVSMTPTFSGCPALHIMKRDIEACVRQLGWSHVTVKTALAPPWSSDWISDVGREKLRAFGLTPPNRHGGRAELIFHELATCPYCNSKNTSLRNSFGPTLCRMIYFCNDCVQPFEKFKAL